MELIRNRTHNRTNGQTVKVVIDKNEYPQKHGNEHSHTASLNNLGCPFTIGFRCPGLVDCGNKNSEHNHKHQNVDVSAYLIIHDLENRIDSSDNIKSGIHE